MLPENKPPGGTCHQITNHYNRDICIPRERARSTPASELERPRNKLVTAIPVMPISMTGLRPIVSVKNGSQFKYCLTECVRNWRTRQLRPMVDGQQLGDGEAAFLLQLISEINFHRGSRGWGSTWVHTHHQTTVETDFRTVFRNLQVLHHFIHVWKNLCECDGVDQPDHA